ncbi:hypothetical protein H6F32_08000 [Anabaena sp. FACHB-1237]|nr:hypothetical protein [Anabaena sp. FACHB-1237]MBD2137526.1 hypothetical protein [Anabaena sp. FACHB-1237]
MFHCHSLAEFSRMNCVGICAFLVPANIVATLATITLTVVNRPLYQVWLSVMFTGMFATLMLLHVYSWLMIGVIMIPTYILLSLAISCLLINLAAIIWRKEILQFVYFRQFNYFLK